MTCHDTAPMRATFPRLFDNSAQQGYEQAATFLQAIGAENELSNFRAVHDQDKGVPAIKRRGTLAQHWQELCEWNKKGYGIFVTVASMDGTGYEANGQPIKDAPSGDKLANVHLIRAHYVDLDSLTALEDLQRAAAHIPPPQFYVQSSPNKAHVYWRLSDRYQDNGWFSVHQSKLAQLYNGDPRVKDATRVLRLPGFFHRKGEPHLVTWSHLRGWGLLTMPGALKGSLAHVNVIQHGGGTRRPLGDPDLAAPSLPFALDALTIADPNDMDRSEWLAFTAAWKQSVWTHTTPGDAFNHWSEWCSRYAANDPGENFKQWDDLEETQIGWLWLESKFPKLKAARIFGSKQVAIDAPPMPSDPNKIVAIGDILTAEEQAKWFVDCVLISTENKIIGVDNHPYDTGSFNSKYGGKLFILDDYGKTTDEAWKAATRGRQFNVDKVEYTCFRPNLRPREIIMDELGRKYVNTYIPAKVRMRDGDVWLFEDHMRRMIPNDQDRETFLDYLAHNIKYPGVKIPWAPLLQSAEGIGKGAIKRVMRKAMGRMYFYEPKAKELSESGAKFNIWMENKLFFLVDEVKTDDRREMVEILKPFITEKELELQGKGRDQRMGDTPGNWLFFSNHKDAIPINKNGRRFAIFYSGLQSAEDIVEAGMDDAYFNRLYDWLDRQDGCEMVAQWLMQRPVERGGLPQRAPITSSTDEALEESKGWLEQFIAEAVEEGSYGFRGGYVSSKMLVAALARDGRHVASKTLATALKNAGYHKIGRAQDSGLSEADSRTYVWSLNPSASASDYSPKQLF